MSVHSIVSGVCLLAVLATPMPSLADQTATSSVRTCAQLLKTFPQGIAVDRASQKAAVAKGFLSPSVQPSAFKQLKKSPLKVVDGVMCAVSAVASATEEPRPSNDPQWEPIAAKVAAAGASCMIVRRDGQLIGEWYWQSREQKTQTVGFSTMKAITATLIGAAQRKGLLALDQPASDFIEEWKGTPSSTVTIRQLMSMTSGREMRPGDDYALVYYTDPTAYAISLGQSDPPGTVWRNSQSAVQNLARVITKATGQTVSSFAQSELFGPLGMTSTALIPDAAGTANMAFHYLTTCRDLSKLVQLYLDRGASGDKRIVNEQFVREALTPSSTLNPGYGLLNRLNTPGTPGFNAALPSDAFDFLGLCGQVGRGVPSQNLNMVVMVTAGLDTAATCDPRGVTIESIRRSLVGPQ